MAQIGSQPVQAQQRGDGARWAITPELAASLATRATASGPKRREAVSPLTGQPFPPIALSTPEDVVRAAREARASQRHWAGLPVAVRARVLDRLRIAVMHRHREVLDLIQLESGKARIGAFEEAADVALVAGYYAGHARRYLAPQRRQGLVPLATQVRVEHRPKGVVGVISPWNYPLTLALADTLPALVAGNAVVLKPDSATPFSALWAAQLADDAGLPPGVLQVVVGAGRDLGDPLISAVDHVAFTGSTEVGRTVAAKAGERLIGSCLELGGKNSMYVADDSDLDAAAECAVRAAFTSAGQLCLSIERLVVHAAVVEPFLRIFRARVRSLKLGVGLDYGADVGCLVSPSQLARVQDHVSDAVAHGAQVVEGGVVRQDVGPLCYAPTILTDVPREAKVYSQETFGPVVSVYPVRNDAEAVRLMNDTDYGLNAAIWTASRRRAAALAGQVTSGMININEGYVATWASVDAPAGGVGASGMGRRHGPEGLLGYTHAVTVARQRGAQAELGMGRLYSLAPQTWTRLMQGALRALRYVGR